jgi:hypothetical protein
MTMEDEPTQVSSITKTAEEPMSFRRLHARSARREESCWLAIYDGQERDSGQYN